MTIDHDQFHDMSNLLGYAAHQAGGVLELPNSVKDELRQQYGEPAPVMIGRDGQGVFACIFPLDELVERGWPFLARTLGCGETVARAAAEQFAASIRTARAIAAERSSGEQEGTSEANPGWSAFERLLRGAGIELGGPEEG